MNTSRANKATERLTTDTIPQSEFEGAIEQYISWASEWDGALPDDVFFGIWADFQRQECPVEVRACIVGGHL